MFKYIPCYFKAKFKLSNDIVEGIVIAIVTENDFNNNEKYLIKKYNLKFPMYEVASILVNNNSLYYDETYWFPNDYIEVLEYESL